MCSWRQLAVRRIGDSLQRFTGGRLTAPQCAAPVGTGLPAMNACV